MNKPKLEAELRINKVAEASFSLLGLHVLGDFRKKRIRQIERDIEWLEQNGE